MKLSLIALSCLLCGAAAIPDKLPSSRRSGKQADTGYGSPAESPDNAYGAPGGGGDSLGEGLAGYDVGLDGQSSADSLSSADYGDDPNGAGGDSGDPLDMLMKAVPGIPGEDYPIYAEAPETAFSCDGQVNGGYYADEEAECQVFHICTADAEGGLSKYSFLCPNGTIFNQEYFICDWWFNVDCAESAALAEAKNGELQGAREEASASLAEGSDYDAAGSDAPAGGYLASDASAPVASYGVSDEDYEEPQPAYNSFRF